MSKTICFLFCFVSFLTVSQNRFVFAADGDLDLSFNQTGRVEYFRSVSISGTSFQGPAVAVQSDGKIIVGYDGLTTPFGSTDAFILTRYNSDGSLDASFGANGTVRTNFGLWETLRQVLIQPDGKILAVGARFASGTAFHDFAVVRYNSNGSLDTNFNGTGGAAIDFGGNGINDFAYGAALQPDGKIVLAGFTDNSGNYVDMDFAFARLNSNGTLDSSFGTSGRRVVPVANKSEWINSIALQSDGKIIATGKIGVGGLFNVTNDEIAILRLNPDGSFDETFRNSGFFTMALSDANESANSAFLQPDGKILIGGSANIGTLTEAALLRFLPNGFLDATFDGDGVVLTTFPQSSGAFFNSTVLQSDEKIIAVGGANGKFALARYNQNGSLDSSFSEDGRVTSEFRPNIRVTSAALQPDGKLVVAGETNGTSDGNWVLAARYQLSITSAKTAFDFDGDGRADVSVFRPANGTWYLNRSGAGFTAQQFGASGDLLVPADYDGDGKTDVAVFRDGNWYITDSSNNAFRAVAFGLGTDVPVAADYDGDRRADIAVFRNGTWYILNSSNNNLRVVPFGQAGDKPVASDYDGDGQADPAVFRDGAWYLLRSAQGFTAMNFGAAGDKAVPADYDGDGRADQAVFRAGAWYLLGSQTGFSAVQFGAPADTPVPADYDGDGKTDVAVFRNGTWYLLRTQAGFTGIPFGASDDRPVPAAFVR